MRLAIFLFLLMTVCPLRGWACDYPAPGFDEQYKQAKTAFIGTVETVENGAVYFTIEKPLKNAGTKQFATENGPSDCDIQFRHGQTWLFLGPTLPAGSLMIGDEYGRAVAGNADLVEKQFDYDYRKRNSVHSGTIRNSCDPLDRQAFTITLDNNVSASVYEPLSSLEGMKDVASWSTGEKAVISRCDSKGQDCRMNTGTISIGILNADESSGRIDIRDDEEHTRSFIFRVRRIGDPALCG